jgi:hypothetical protein
MATLTKGTDSLAKVYPHLVEIQELLTLATQIISEHGPTPKQLRTPDLKEVLQRIVDKAQAAQKSVA